MARRVHYHLFERGPVMNLRFLLPVAVSMLLPACAAEVLGEPEAEEVESVASASEELASSSKKFTSFFLPASREALCVFGDGSTYRGAAATRDAAYLACQRRAVDAAPGTIDARIQQNRAANGTCTTALVIDGVVRNQRTSACNSTINGRASGGQWYTGTLGSGPGLTWWWVGCFALSGVDNTGIATVSCLSVAVDYY